MLESEECRYRIEIELGKTACGNILGDLCSESRVLWLELHCNIEGLLGLGKLLHSSLRLCLAEHCFDILGFLAENLVALLNRQRPLGQFDVRCRTTHVEQVQCIRVHRQ
jgi:hypothetical protein